jgi:carbon catabolite-derepressing protein kinase
MRNSQVAIDKAANRPEGMTPLPQKKPKPTRWQFGIRSRNAPHEAMLCIYKALKRLGAEWEVDDDSVTEGEEEDVGGNEGGHRGNKNDRSRHAEASDLPIDGGPLHHESSLGTPSPVRRREGEKRRRAKERNADAGYVPKDPWCIKARWKKDGMYPPGTVNPNSAQSSTINLQEYSDKTNRKRSSTVGSLTTSGQEVATTTTSMEAPRADDSCYVYMEIQLYVLEPDTYLVDFKCDGYETVYKLDDGERYHFTGTGRQVEEKDVSSPFPFLDLAGKLIIALAEAD